MLKLATTFKVALPAGALLGIAPRYRMPPGSMSICCPLSRRARLYQCNLEQARPQFSGDKQPAAIGVISDPV